MLESDYGRSGFADAVVAPRTQEGSRVSMPSDTVPNNVQPDLLMPPDSLRARNVASVTGLAHEAGAPGSLRPALRGYPLAYHLVALCFAVVLPILVLAAVLTWFYADSERRTMERAGLMEARTIMGEIDRHLASLIATTEVVALSRALRVADFDTFDSQARDVYSRLGINVVLRDLSGQQLVNTRLPRGASLPRNTDESDRLVLSSKRSVVSDLFIGAVARKPLFIVNVPVFTPDHIITYLLNLSLPPEHILDLILELQSPPGWGVTVADGQGNVIASTNHAKYAVGQLLPSGILEKIPRSESIEGNLVLHPADGPTFAAFSRSRTSGWFALVTAPTTMLSAPLRRSLIGLLGLTVVILALAAALATLFSRRIEGPVGALAVEAARLGQGDAARTLSTLVREINEVSAVLSASSAKRQATEVALREGERRFRELQSELLHAARLSAMGQMAAALAHELNQPLGAATNFINAARLKLAKGDPDGPARALERIEKASEQTVRAGAILRRLRDFVAGGESDKRIVSAARLVEDAVALAMIGVHDPQLRTRLDLQPGDALPVLADRIQMQQVIFNLVRNALEATEGRQPREILVAARSAANGEVEISVADTGPGLPQDQEILFQPFGTTKDSGLGLGLSICRTIVEMHGGHLRAEPRAGGGAVFRFTIPAERMEGATHA